jgi:hypothetical protein
MFARIHFEQLFPLLLVAIPAYRRANCAGLFTFSFNLLQHRMPIDPLKGADSPPERIGVNR